MVISLRHRAKIFSLGIGLTIFSPDFANARAVLDFTGPLNVRTQNPLLLNRLALPFETPRTLDRGQVTTELSTTFTNLFEYSPVTPTTVDFDMELWRTTAAVSVGLAPSLDARAEFSFVTTGGGFLDAFVQGYHDAFGFPNGGRNLVANGRFQYKITRGGVTLIDKKSAAFGVGDASLRLKWQISDFWSRRPVELALVAGLKAPTGDRGAGLSSGRFDFGLGAVAQKTLGRFQLNSQAGLLIWGGEPELGAIANHVAGQFGQSVEFRIVPGLSAVAQLTGTTPAFHDTGADELSAVAMDANIGLTGAFKTKAGTPWRQIYYQASFGEDILAIGPAADFSLMFLIGARY